MKKILPGRRPPKIPQWHLSEFLPDPRYPAIPDTLERNQFSQGGLIATHTTLGVGDTITQTVDTLQRAHSVQVGAVAGGTVTIQVQVEGRDIFDDAERPVSGGEVKLPNYIYNFPAGTPVSTIIEATSGVPTGSANLVIETEPFTLVPKSERVVLKGGDRLRVSRRREADIANAGGNLIEGGLLGPREGQRTKAASAQLDRVRGPLPQPPRVKTIARGGNPARRPWKTWGRGYSGR